MIYSIYKHIILFVSISCMSFFSLGQYMTGPTQVNCNGTGGYSIHDPQGGSCTGNWYITRPNGSSYSSSGGSAFVSWGASPGFGNVVFSGTCVRQVVVYHPNGGISYSNQTIPLNLTRSVQVGSGQLSKPSIYASGSFCNNETKSISISSVSGAVNYTYQLPAGWSIQGGSNVQTTNQTTVNVTAPSSGQASNVILQVRANGVNCVIPSQYAYKTIRLGSFSPSIVGSSVVAANSTNEYFGTNVQGLTGGNWSAPGSWTVVQDYGVSSQIYQMPSSGSGTITLSGYSCGVYVQASKSVTISSGPFIGPKSLALTEEVEQESEFSVSVYPNPSSDYLNFDTHENEVEKIQLFDASGQLTFEQQGSEKMNVSAISAGLYFVQITGINGESVTEKIQIRH